MNTNGFPLRGGINRTAPVLIAALCLSPLLCGCGAGSGSASIPVSGFSRDGVTTRSATIAAGGTSLKIVFSTPKSVYPSGATVTLNVSITNVGTTAYVYTVCGLDNDASAVETPGGPVVWQWSYGHAIPDVCATDLTLAPGATVTDQLTWNQGENAGIEAPPGTYAVSFYPEQLPQSLYSTAVPPLYITIGG